MIGKVETIQEAYMTYRNSPLADVGHPRPVKGKGSRAQKPSLRGCSGIKNHHDNSGIKKNEFFNQSKNPSSSIIANTQHMGIGVKRKMIYKNLMELVSRDLKLMNEVGSIERYPIISLEKLFF